MSCWYLQICSPLGIPLFWQWKSKDAMNVCILFLVFWRWMSWIWSLIWVGGAVPACFHKQKRATGSKTHGKWMYKIPFQEVFRPLKHAPNTLSEGSWSTRLYKDFNLEKKRLWILNQTLSSCRVGIVKFWNETIVLFLFVTGILRRLVWSLQLIFRFVYPDATH